MSIFLGLSRQRLLQLFERLQAIQYRVFVDASGAVTETIPKAPDLSDVPHGVEIEGVFKGIAAAGLNAWIPFSTDVVLPRGPTKFAFEKIESGYRLTLNGPDLASTLLLGPDMRVTSGVARLPQPMRVIPEFSPGPNGLLVSSLRINDKTDAATATDNVFSFTYQNVEGFQIPASIAIKSASPETWHYTLTGCKVQKRVAAKMEPPRN